MSVSIKQFMFHNECIGKTINVLLVKNNLCFIMSVSVKQFMFHNECIGKTIYVS